MTNTNLSIEQVGEIAQNALVNAGATPKNAASVARSTQRAERDGIRSHGLLYVPIYAQHVQCGKVVGDAEPVVKQTRPGAISVDAKSGFAHPAIDAGWDKMIDAAKINGIAAMTIYNSYNCGVLGHHAERIAENGMLGLCFTHAPASIAPIGGKSPVIGTNPISVATPNSQGGADIVLDQSASVIAKSEILLRNRTGEAIEPGWALDANGEPTTDAAQALKGTMLPSGGYKGFGIGLLVEIMASCLSGATSSKNASPFAGTAGGPPGTGQCFIAIDPGAYSDGFSGRIRELCAVIETQENARVPGSRRFNNRKRIDCEGVNVDAELMERLKAI